MGKIKNILLFLAPFLLTQCANVVAPTGGTKDTTPPKVTEAVPANYSTGFNGRKVEITFDEYVTLNNANQNVLFSPLLKTKPDIKLNGKTVVIKFKEELQPNTTYTIDFGQAVKDLHEGNLFKDYVYSFSTGDHLDTLTLAGKVLNADDQKAVPDLFVSLYESQCDSLFDLPTRCAPDFITKTDKEGAFKFHGLPDKQFLVFALNDMNSNYYYDMPNEKVAFLDTLVHPADTLNLTLYAFIEEDTTQMLLEKKLLEEGLLRFVFRLPADKVSITTPDELPDSFHMAKVWSKEMDTLLWYFTPKVLDSLWITIHYDTLINDSTRFTLIHKESRQRRTTPKPLNISNNLRNNLLLPGEDLILKFSEPVTDIRIGDTSLLIAGTDSTYINYSEMDFEPADDHGMAFRLKKSIEDTLNYTFSIADSVFFSIRGKANKATSLRFKRAKNSDLGNIILTVEPPFHTQAVVQLLNNRGAVVGERTIDSIQKLTFTQLPPEKYKIQAIIDNDCNEKWSTGNFHRRFLPETVIPYKDELDVKAGWDIDLDETWTLKP